MKGQPLPDTGCSRVRSDCSACSIEKSCYSCSSSPRGVNPSCSHRVRERSLRGRPRGRAENRAGVQAVVMPGGHISAGRAPGGAPAGEQRGVRAAQPARPAAGFSASSLPGTELGKPREFLLPERALVSGPWVTREVIAGIVLLSVLVIYSSQHTREVSGLLLLLFFSPLTSGGKNRCNLLFPGLLGVPRHCLAMGWSRA